jgi:hypothetical protein
MAQPTKIETHDTTLHGLALLNDPISTRVRRSRPKSAVNTGWKVSCRIRWKTLIDRLSV